jgi:hypothetical protein
MNTKIFGFYLILLFFPVFSYSGIPPRNPFVVLRINGTEYQPNAEIHVRPGERLVVEAILMGGKRDYCSDPDKYANVGKNTVINTKGEDGMSFTIGDGTFRGTWTLKNETAVFSSAEGLTVSPKQTSGTIQRTAIIEIPKSGYSKIYLKVKSETNWHYVRHTQAGKQEQDENNKGESTFYFVIGTEEGVWYSSANITAKGIDNFSVRNSLDRIQSLYRQIEERLMKKDYSGAEMQINNLKTSISDLKSTVETQKQKDKNFTCEITFIGLPSDIPMQDLSKIKIMADKWKEMALIAQGNVSRINTMLLNSQMGFSANVLRSVFKNYINWGTSIPTGAEDLLSIYDPNNIFGPVDLPRKFLGFYEEANNDASILQNQVRTIKLLSELRKFYEEKMTNSTTERRELFKIINDLKPLEEKDSALRTYFSSLGWAKFRSR